MTFQNIDLRYSLSFSGLIPFIIIIFDKYFLFQISEEIVTNFLIYYTLLILVFIGATNWNFDADIKYYIVIYGFLPSFFSVIIIILNLLNFDQIKIIFSIIVLLVIQFIIDYILIYSKRNDKNYFYFLRLPLTVLITIILILIII